MQIEWENKAIKQLKKIGNIQVVKRIYKSIEFFANGGVCDVKTLVNHTYTHRLRIGRYRVLMSVVEGKTTIVYIEEVKKRDESTYG